MGNSLALTNSRTVGYSSIATVGLRHPSDDVRRQKGCKVRIARHPPTTGNWNPSPHSWVYLRFGNRRKQRLDFGIGAQADLRSRKERYLVSSQTKLSKVWSNLGSSPSWLRFKYPDVPNHHSVASNWMYPAQ